MKKIFNISEGFKVPDGTMVHSVLDPRVASQYKSEWVDDISTAVGVIPAGITSKIHLHPLVTQVTWVLSGNLTVKMKDPKAEEPYSLNLSKDQSVVTKAGTFFQLVNSGKEECRVIYIVTPAFVFECSDKGEVVYNDALVLDQDWEELAKAGWKVPEMADIKAVRKVRNGSKARLKSSLSA